MTHPLGIIQVVVRDLQRLQAYGILDKNWRRAAQYTKDVDATDEDLAAK